MIRYQLNTVGSGVEFYGFDVDEDKKFITINFSSESRIRIPKDRKMYVYLSCGEQPYMLKSAKLRLTFDYIK